MREAGTKRREGAKPYVLAQTYVPDPMLIDGRKFGIRVWVVVTGHNPLRAYLHCNGLVLFSTSRWVGGIAGEPRHSPPHCAECEVCEGGCSGVSHTSSLLHVAGHGTAATVSSVSATGSTAPSCE